MKALSLHGAWAHYEQQHACHEGRIAELEKQVGQWRRMAEECKEALSKAEAERSAVLTNELPSLREENERARNIIAKMESEMMATKDAASAAMQAVETQLTGLQGKAQQLTAENMLLKQELAKTVQVRSSTHSKVDEARRRLGLTATEAQIFVKEFDEACRSNALLRKEVAQLQGERSDLQQQCENRSQHCMTLIAENKRLADQIAELRRQTVELDQEGWRLRQQISASAQRQQHVQHKRDVAAAATKGRPGWQSNAAASTGMEKKSTERSTEKSTKDIVQKASSNSQQALSLVAPVRIIRQEMSDVTNAAAGQLNFSLALGNTHLPSAHVKAVSLSTPLVEKALR